jgi:hypothetical protein
MVGHASSQMMNLVARVEGVVKERVRGRHVLIFVMHTEESKRNIPQAH